MNFLLGRNKSVPASSSDGAWSLRRAGDDSNGASSSASALQSQPLTGSRSLGASLFRGTQRNERRTAAIRPNWQSAPVLAGPGHMLGDSKKRSQATFAETMYATGVMRPSQQRPPSRGQPASPQSTSRPSTQETMIATLQVVRPQSQGSIKRERPETFTATLQISKPQASGFRRIHEPETLFATGVIRPQSQGSIKPKKLFNVGHSRNKQKVRQAMSTMDEGARLRRFEQVLEDNTICANKRFSRNLESMREEAPGLASLAKVRQQVKLDEDTAHADQLHSKMSVYNEFLAQQEEDEKVQAALRIQKIMRGKATRRRIAKLKTSTFLSFEDHDVADENGEVDLRKSKYWNPKFMYVCDIKEKKGDRINDFLFLADIHDDGTMKARVRRGRCVFNAVMYDIQDFVPRATQDGRIEFDLKFGINTKERRDVPQGWKISFSVAPSCSGHWEGTCHSSWWGSRKVELIQYETLSEEEKQQYPDLVAKYYRSWTGKGAGAAFQTNGNFSHAKTTAFGSGHGSQEAPRRQARTKTTGLSKPVPW